MATLEELQDALVNADKAGDANAARQLADEIVRIQSSQQPQTRLAADRAMADDAQVAAQTAEGRREAYNQLPEWQKPIVATNDVARLMGNPLGVGDKFAAYMNSGDRSYEDQLKIEKNITQAARDRADTAALPAEIMGDVLTGGAVAKQGLTLAGRLGTANMTGLKGLTARAALMAPEGALWGTADALGRDADVATGATVGALAGPVGSVVGDTVSKVASKVLPAKTASKVPSLDALYQSADDAYKASEKAGVVIRPEVAQRIRANVQAKLTEFGYHPQNQPGARAALEELDRISQGNITLKGMDIARRVARNGYNPQNPSNNAAIEIIVGELDDVVKKIGPNDIIAGDPRQGLNSLAKARELWTRVRKNERFMDQVSSAELRAKSNQVYNIDSATRQKVRPLMDPAIKSAPKNWSPDEAAALNDIVEGTIGKRTLSWLGKLAPTGIVSGGLGTSMGASLGAFLGGPAGAAVGSTALPMLGQMAKFGADRAVLNAVKRMDELIRVGGSAADLEAAQAVLRSLSKTQREAVASIIQMSIQSQVRSKAPAEQ